MEKSLNNKELRKTYKSIRDSLSLQDRAYKSQQIIEHILALLESDFKGANIFLCFYPFGSEVDLRSLYQRILDTGKELYFPVSDVKNHLLSFYKVTDLKSDFKLGAYDILEPKNDLPTFDESIKVAVVFTPGLIFDKYCNRIGYGAGYYDRFYSKHDSFVKIGVGFKEQLIDCLDVKEHDVPLDYIVTDDGLIKRGM